ncbi:hypothetical protein CDAR_127561 [Caerostris darwini]|uniref:Uncharacterized protein n=1 Tax=Caerostris darwini TaxID=1538125 RepID=A0AAV4UW87_9ARAC|nr:hypothetical protein CDAR_127561 [Caerostris darwini]
MCSTVWLESVVGVHCSPYFRKRIDCSGEEARSERRWPSANESIRSAFAPQNNSYSLITSPKAPSVKVPNVFLVKGDYRQDCSWMSIGGALQIPIVVLEGASLLKREASVVGRVLINQFAASRLRIGTGVVANCFSESTLGKSAKCFLIKGDYRQDFSWIAYWRCSSNSQRSSGNRGV